MVVMVMMLGHLWMRMEEGGSHSLSSSVEQENVFLPPPNWVGFRKVFTKPCTIGLPLYPVGNCPYLV